MDLVWSAVPGRRIIGSEHKLVKRKHFNYSVERRQVGKEMRMKKNVNVIVVGAVAAFAGLVGCLMLIVR